VLVHHHGEGAVGGAQLLRGADVQVGQQDGRAAVPVNRNGGQRTAKGLSGSGGALTLAGRARGCTPACRPSG